MAIVWSALNAESRLDRRQIRSKEVTELSMAFSRPSFVLPRLARPLACDKLRACAKYPLCVVRCRVWEADESIEANRPDLLLAAVKRLLG
jgi:hypothetical protein